MPLPPAPSKPADRLPVKAFAAHARSAARPELKQDSAPTAKLQTTNTTADKKPPKQNIHKTRSVLLSPASPMVVEPAVNPQTTPARTTARSKKPLHTGPSKLFVLDTNVLLHDPMSLFRFEEHDIYLPMIVLEELDGHKKGMTEVARNARQTSRTLDALAGTPGADITAGFMLASTGHRDARGKLLFQTQSLD